MHGGTTSAQFPAELMVCQYCRPPLVLVVRPAIKEAERLLSVALREPGAGAASFAVFVPSAFRYDQLTLLCFTINGKYLILLVFCIS